VVNWDEIQYKKVAYLPLNKLLSAKEKPETVTILSIQELAKK